MSSIQNWFNHFVLAFFVVGCGSNGPVAQLTVRGAASLQEVSATPWPSDLFLDDGGHVALAKLPTSDVALTPFVLQDLQNQEDGFGVTSGAFFPVSAPIDPATLDGHVHLYDLEAKRELPVVTHFRANDRPFANIYARAANGVVFLERHKYAWVLTRDVRGPKGALAPSSDLSTLLNARSAPSGTVGRAYPIYQPLLSLLGTAPFPKAGDVAAATVFTTHSITSRLVAMRAALGSAPAPAARVSMIFAKSPTGNEASLDSLLGTPAMNLPGGDNPGGPAHDHIGFVVQGSFSSPDYIDASTTVTAAGGSATVLGTFDESSGAPRPRGTATVPFTLVLPDAAAFNNVPVVVFQHGLGGDRSSVMSVANTLASAGFATLGIDIPYHGARDATATDTKHTYGGGAGPDGWAEWTDNPSYAFFDALGSNDLPGLLPGAVRAAFMQAAIDVMQEIRLVTVGDVSAVGARDARLNGLTFRKDAVGYSGESFGAMYGVIAMAIEPSVGAALFDVGGGGLIFPLLLNSADEGPVFVILLDGALGTSTVDPADPADTDFGYNLAQYLLEGGDPAAYAPYVITHPASGSVAKHVLQLSAHLDETVPNQANEALANALGLTPFNLSDWSPDLRYWPNAPSMGSLPTGTNVKTPSGDRVAVFLQFDPATHGLLTTQHAQRRHDVSQPLPYPAFNPPVPVANPVARAQSIYLGFMKTYFANGTPTVAEGP